MEGWIVLGLILIVIAYLFGRIGFAVEEDKERSEYAYIKRDWLSTRS